MQILVNKTAEDLDKKIMLVNHVQRRLFKSIKERIAEGTYNNLLLQGFGKFVVKPKKKEILDKAYAKYGDKGKPYVRKNNTNISEVEVLETESQGGENT